MPEKASPGHHSRLLGVLEDAAGFDDWCDIPQGLERVTLVALTDVGQGAVLHVNQELVASGVFLDKGGVGLERDEVTAVHAIAEKDTGVKLGDDAGGAGLGNGQGGVLTRGA